MDSMLSRKILSALSEFNHGPLNQLVTNLGGKNGDLIETELKRFNRKEPCWMSKPNKAIKARNHLIDLCAPPFCPDCWEVVEHKRIGFGWNGQFEWDPKKVALHLEANQYRGVVGNDLRKALADKPVLNANLLHYLLAHPELIPEDWKGKTICFWGTIYRHDVGELFVRYLVWSGSEWYWGERWLGREFDANSPAVVLAAS